MVYNEVPVPVEVRVQHIVDRVEIREVPTDRIVMQEVPVMVDKVIVRDVPYPVERFVEKDVIKEIQTVVVNQEPIYGLAIDTRALVAAAVHALPRLDSGGCFPARLPLAAMARHTHAHARPHAQSCLHALSVSVSHTHTHTHTHARKHTHAHAHALIVTLALSHSGQDSVARGTSTRRQNSGENCDGGG